MVLIFTLTYRLLEKNGRCRGKRNLWGEALECGGRTEPGYRGLLVEVLATRSRSHQERVQRVGVEIQKTKVKQT